MNNLVTKAFVLLMVFSIIGCSGNTKFTKLEDSELKYNVNVLPKSDKELTLKLGNLNVERKTIGLWWPISAYTLFIPTTIYAMSDGSNRRTIAKDTFTKELDNVGIKLLFEKGDTDLNTFEDEFAEKDTVKENYDYIIDFDLETTSESAFEFVSRITVRNGDRVAFQKTYFTSPTNHYAEEDDLLKSAYTYVIKQFIHDKQAHIAMGINSRGGNIQLASSKSTQKPTITLNKPQIIDTAKTIANNQKLLALVIGNSSYKSTPLKNPVNDANDISANLENLGFDVNTLIDADRRNIVHEINRFSRKLNDYDVGLFFYAGHGMQIKGRNFLIPIDAHIESDSDVEFEGVDIGRLLAKMESYENKTNIVLLDACRNNPFSGTFRSSSRGLARVDAPTGSFIAFATAPGQVAADGFERNGVFTKHLLKHINTPDLPIEGLLKKVRVGVMKETNSKQVPWQSSSMTGDFYFRNAVANNENSVIAAAATTEIQAKPITPVQPLYQPKKQEPEQFQQARYFDNEKIITPETPPLSSSTNPSITDKPVLVKEKKVNGWVSGILGILALGVIAGSN